MKSFRVSTGEAGRADIFIASHYPSFSRSSLNVLFEDGLVQLDSQKIKPSFKLKPGDKLLVDDEILFREFQIDMPIIYEDEQVIVIDKPAGVLTHSKGARSEEATVASFISPKLEKGLGGNRAGIVHRLDRATSGIIIAAKTEAAQKFLQKEFSTHKVGKTYLAVVAGILEPEAGTIMVPIARNKRSPKKFAADANGKSAETSYRTLNSSGGYSLVELTPKTGRTHQLRVHLAHLGHPIVGDDLYGGEPAGRMMLHAAELDIKLPNGKSRSFSSLPPKEFNIHE